MAPRLRLLLLLPAGCTAPGEQEAMALRSALESGQASLAAVAPATTPATLPAAVAPPRASLARLDLQPAALRHEPRRDSPGPRPAAAAQLVGAAPETLRRWLGEPSLRRREGSAEVWLYAGEACALDLVLYPAGGGLRVAHAAARANGPEPRTEDACLREIGAGQAPHAIPAAGGSGRVDQGGARFEEPGAPALA